MMVATLDLKKPIQKTKGDPEGNSKKSIRNLADACWKI